MSPTLTAPAPGTDRRRRTLSAGLALAGAAITFTNVSVTAGALTPLLVVYKEQWAFPAVLLTVAFAVYAGGFLVAALTLGSLSDRVGRRPVLIAALAVQIVSNVLLLLAPDVGWVIAGRIVQGVAGGAATAAFTAVLVELAPANLKRLGAVLGSVGLTGGLALGSLLAGFAIELTPTANSIVFIILTVITIIGTVGIALSPETVRRSPGALRSLIPRASVPTAARREFAAAAPVIAAVWMLGGLSGGIAPSLVRSVFHLDSGLLNGAIGFVAPAVSAVIGLTFARVDSRRAMTIGIYASIAGSIAIIGGVLAGTLLIMIVGQAIAGVGFGASFTAALRLIVPLVAIDERSGVVSAIYVVSYVAFGVPIVAEGLLAGAIGDVPAVVWYTVLTLLFALISLIAQIRITGTHRGIRLSADPADSSDRLRARPCTRAHTTVG